MKNRSINGCTSLNFFSKSFSMGGISKQKHKYDGHGKLGRVNTNISVPKNFFEKI